MFLCCFVILCHRGWKMKYFLFLGNDFGTLAFFFSQSCLCVTFTSWSTPSLGMLLSKLSNRNTHVFRIRMISVFYPSVWIVQKLQCFKWCQPCVCRMGGGERVGQANVDRPGQGKGGQKFPNLSRHPLWMNPSMTLKLGRYYKNEIFNRTKI